MPSRLGSPNKQKAFLLSRLKAMYGEDFDPIMKMAEKAHAIDQIALESGEMEDHKAALSAFAAIAEYTTPKLRSVEIKTHDALTVSVIRKRYDANNDEKCINVNENNRLQDCAEKPPPFGVGADVVYTPPPQKKIK